MTEGRSRAALAAGRERAEAILDGLDAAAAYRLGSDLTAVAALLDDNFALRRALGDAASSPTARSGLARRIFSGQLADGSLDLLADVVALIWSTLPDLTAGISELATEAVLAAAQKEGQLDDVEDELFRFSRTLDREAQLSLALSNPGLPAEQKTKLLDRLLEGKAQLATRSLIAAAVVATGGHGLDRRLDQLTVLAAARRQRLVAVVRVASALSQEQAERLRSALATTYGRDIHLQIDLDPTVLGGVIVQVGDEILDGSVARRIAQARARL